MPDIRDPFEYDALYDLPPYPGMPRTYLIATTQRTGSHYLAHLLASTPWGGVPFEYVNAHRVAQELRAREWPVTVESEVTLLTEMKRRRVGATGLFGVKAHWHSWHHALERQGVGDLVRPESVIYLARRDRVAQAASLALAEQSGVWVDFGRGGHEPPEFSAEAVAKALNRIDAECRAWDDYLSARPEKVLPVWYEDVREDPASALRAIRDFLGVKEEETAWRDLPMPVPSVPRVADDWAARFAAIVSA